MLKFNVNIQLKLINKIDNSMYMGYMESKVNDKSVLCTHMVIILWTDKVMVLGRQ